jgi:hypothetical protein
MTRSIVMTLVSKFEVFKYASKEAKERLLDVMNLCWKLQIIKEK